MTVSDNAITFNTPQERDLLADLGELARIAMEHPLQNNLHPRQARDKVIMGFLAEVAKACE